MSDAVSLAGATSLTGTVRRGEYQRSWWRPDLLAGLTVAAMLVPQAMAYAELGGLPPSSGFRAVLVALPIYALLGTSRHLGVGPEPGTAILAASAVAPLAAGDPDRYLALMAAMAGLVGGVALLAGLLRLGFVADLLSKPVLVGYITGVGITLLTSQLRTFTGVEIDTGEPFERIGQFVTRLDQIDATTIGLGVATLAIIQVLRWRAPTWPGALIGLAASMVVVALFELDVDTVGRIEAAFPTPNMPDVGLGDLRDLIGPAAGVALIGYTDNILTARSIAAKQGYDVDADRELVALGAVNAAGAVGGGFPMSSSASRSFVPATIGAYSQLVSVVAFVALIVVLGVGRSLLADIPRAGLAAVIVAAAIAVVDVDGFRRIASISYVETGLAVITCVVVVGTDLLVGVVLAVVLSLLVTVARVARPHDAILGSGEGLDGWINVEDERAVIEPGLLVYRFDAPLFFANAEHFRERLALALDRNPGEELMVVVDMEGIGSIDTTAVDQLDDMVSDLREAGMIVGIARANARVVGVLERSGLRERLGDDAVFPTINAAVAAYRSHGGRTARGGGDDSA
ncbi:MAG: SulP family inorganic anion transporter [Actinomycetota bacterium]